MDADLGLTEELRELSCDLVVGSPASMSAQLSQVDGAVLSGRALEALGPDGLMGVRRQNPEVAIVGTDVHRIAGTDDDVNPAQWPVDAARRIVRAVEGRRLRYQRARAHARECALVVDDDPLVLESVRAVVEASHLEVEVAADGVAAIASLRHLDVGIVLTDLVMPGTHGLSLLEFVRAFDPSIVCLAMSGLASAENLRGAMRAGALDLLEKPMRSAVLHEAIRRAASERSHRVFALEAHHQAHVRPRTPLRSALLVADHVTSRFDAMAQALGAADREIVRATSGAAAIDACSTRDFALAIVAQDLPDHGGLQVVSALTRSLTGPRTPAMLVTSDPVAHADEAYRTGAADVVSRSAPIAVVLARVNQFVELWHARREQARVSELERRLDRLAGDRDAATRADMRVRFATMYDSLTGLGNRTMLEHEIARWIERKGRAPQAAAAALLLDIDGFTTLNDSLGARGGDEILSRIAERIRDTVRPSDVVCRIGDDAFGVLLDQADAELAARLASRLLSLSSEPILVGGRQVHLTACIGLSVGRGEELLRNAEAALARARREGRGQVQAFDPRLHADALHRLQLESDLRQALRTGRGIDVMYQPIVSVSDGKHVATEVLCRWLHPDRGAIPPDVFVPLAEELGIVEQLTDRVLELALRQVSVWRAAHKPLIVSVNISAWDLDDRLPARIRERLDQFGLSGSDLWVELTESAVMADAEQARGVLERVREMGVRVAIDDFGTGYSSLAYLHQLPIDELKIDKSFVARVEHEDQLVDVVLALAQKLGVGVVAEGVETQSQLAAIRRLGCRAAQGYLFARPTSAADLKV